jgi:hypothetical protein
MSTVDITVAEKTYHVDVAWLPAKPLKVTVDGQPLEIYIRNTRDIQAWEAQQVRQAAPAEKVATQAAPLVDVPAGNKPVIAEYHWAASAE